MKVYLVSLANGEQSWARGNGANPSLSAVWKGIQRGDSFRANRERPVNSYALREPDWGVRVIYNPAFVTNVAELPVAS